ncbi:MAG: 3-hydroxyacyl-CoA dehydrogenase NAD-binding domain-containing protein, partial [Actinomycetota bacterium]
MAESGTADGPGALPERAAVVGCGVIGAAWASRMVLCGVDVAVSDPMPNAEETLQQVLDNAVAAW